MSIKAIMEDERKGESCGSSKRTDEAKVGIGTIIITSMETMISLTGLLPLRNLLHYAVKIGYFKDGSMERVKVYRSMLRGQKMRESG